MAKQYLLHFLKRNKSKWKSKDILRYTVLRWLFAEQDASPDALAFDVATRFVSVKADIVAAWYHSAKEANSNKKYFAVKKNAIFVCIDNRAECWAQCANPEQILAELGKLRSELAVYEEEIRLSEPHLRDKMMLFEEYAHWDYGKSENQTYQNLRKRALEMEYSLYNGSILQKIHSYAMADELYLVAPEKELSTEEILPGWGLLAVTNDLQVKLLQLPAKQRVSEQAQQHLSLNMLKASLKASLEANNFSVSAQNEIQVLGRVRRRKIEEPDSL
jgi:hypothetical protein